MVSWTLNRDIIIFTDMFALFLLFDEIIYIYVYLKFIYVQTNYLIRNDWLDAFILAYNRSISQMFKISVPLNTWSVNLKRKKKTKNEVL